MAMKKRLSKTYYLILCTRGFVYEHAEGGYYVPTQHIQEQYIFHRLSEVKRWYRKMITWYGTENDKFIGNRKTFDNYTEWCGDSWDDGVVIAYTTNPEKFVKEYNHFE